MSTNLPFYLRSKYPVELKYQPIVKSKKQFYDECRFVWDNYDNLDMIVDLIEDLMKDHSVTYLYQNMSTAITGDNGTRVLDARDQFTMALDNMKSERQLIAVLNNHLNFIKSNLC